MIRLGNRDNRCSGEACDELNRVVYPRRQDFSRSTIILQRNRNLTIAITADFNETYF